MHRILIIEDDFSLNNTLAYNLRTAGYTVDSAYNAKEAFKYLKQYHYILLILDINLPDGNGFELYSELKEKSNASIIFLTANDLENDIVKGFDLGADDYITKPFNILELKARIKAILRRSVRVVTHEESKSNIIKSRDLEIDLESRRCFIKGKEKNLTAKEFDLLELFMKNPGKVYSRDNLLTTIWGAGYPGDVRAVDVHVRRLREKIEAVPSEPEYIHTKWGVGYYFQ